MTEVEPIAFIVDDDLSVCRSIDRNQICFGKMSLLCRELSDTRSPASLIPIFRRRSSCSGSLGGCRTFRIRCGVGGTGTTRVGFVRPLRAVGQPPCQANLAW